MTRAAEWFEPVPSRTARLAENFDRLVRELVERDYISSELARQAKLV
jgi:hypothetical protein